MKYHVTVTAYFNNTKLLHQFITRIEDVNNPLATRMHVVYISSTTTTVEDICEIFRKKLRSDLANDAIFTVQEVKDISHVAWQQVLSMQTTKVYNQPLTPDKHNFHGLTAGSNYSLDEIIKKSAHKYTFSIPNWNEHTAPGFATESKKLPGVNAKVDYPCGCTRDIDTSKYKMWTKDEMMYWNVDMSKTPGNSVEPTPVPQNGTIWGAIQHLNDKHKWTREKIADWLDELHDSGQINLEFEVETISDEEIEEFTAKEGGES